MKKVFVLALVTVLLFAFTACSPQASPDVSSEAPAESANAPAETPAEKESFKIGLSMWTLEWDFFQLSNKSMQLACEENGATFVIHDQKQDQAEMVSGCMNLLNQDIDALVITPFAPSALPPIVEAAHEKGVIVVVCDVGTGGSNYDAFITSDNWGGGVANGEQIVKILTEKGITGKKYAMIRPSTENPLAQQRNDGAKSVLDAAGYELVQDLYGDATTDNGFKLMNDILAANPDIVAVVTGNDQAAAGAAQACLDAGRDDIIITGFDYSDQGLEGLRNGTIDATVAQFPYDLGHTSVEVAIKLLRGEPVEYDKPELREIDVPVKLMLASDIVADINDQWVSSTGITRKDIGMGR